MFSAGIPLQEDYSDTVSDRRHCTWYRHGHSRRSRLNTPAMLHYFYAVVKPLCIDVAVGDGSNELTCI